MQKTDNLKVNPPLGRLPVLQFVMPGELQIDRTYQRALDDKSHRLIRKIAQYWNWDLCQPLVVSRRQEGALFVIDGQHRLAAAKLRGDIPQLPCVVVEYTSSQDEAASFVALNQVRKPLNKIEIFKAAVASGDTESCAILDLIERAGLSIAPHYNYVSWKPGMLTNIGGLQAGFRKFGGGVTYAALRALLLAFPDEVLRYGGTIYPGLVAVCFEVIGDDEAMAEKDIARIAKWLGRSAQSDWRQKINTARAENSSFNFARASAAVLLQSWDDRPNAPAPSVAPQPAFVRTNGCSLDRFDAREKGESEFCEQCDCLVPKADAAACDSQFCSLRKAA